METWDASGEIWFNLLLVVSKRNFFERIKRFCVNDFGKKNYDYKKTKIVEKKYKNSKEIF